MKPVSPYEADCSATELNVSHQAGLADVGNIYYVGGVAGDCNAAIPVSVGAAGVRGIVARGGEATRGREVDVDAVSGGGELEGWN